MRSTIINKKEKGYFGPHACTLNPGDGKHFMFKEDDIGPFWMTERMRTEKRKMK
jgi:hypothetical protein